MPRKSFPITYKYGLQRKGGDMELEVRPQPCPETNPMRGSAKVADVESWGGFREQMCTEPSRLLAVGQVGENRIASLVQPEGTGEGDAAAAAVASAEPVMLVRDDGPFRHETSWRGAAVAVPVFSLRTRDSVGVGEFDDIRQLVDLCHTAGVRPATP